MERMRPLIEAAIVGSPFGRHLGLHCEEIAADRVRLRLPFAATLATVGSVIHGGAIASLADAAATAACWASPHVPPGARGTTIALSLQYLNAGRAQDLLATAEVIQRGGSVCVAEVTVRGIDGTLVARASSTYKLSAPALRVSDATGSAHTREPASLS